MTWNARKSKVALVPPSTERKLPLYPRQLRRSSNFFPKSAPKCQLLMKGQNKGRKNFLIFEGVKFLMCFAQCRCSPMLTVAHRCLPGYLDDHDVKRAKIHFLPNNRGELFSTIFRPFSAIFCHCLPAHLDVHNKKRAETHDCHFPPFSTIFCHCLPGYLIVHNKKRAETHDCQFLQC